jgi:hypothetical protein
VAEGGLLCSRHKLERFTPTRVLIVECVRGRRERRRLGTRLARSCPSPVVLLIPPDLARRARLTPLAARSGFPCRSDVTEFTHPAAVPRAVMTHVREASSRRMGRVMRYRSLKRELEKLRGDLAEREQQLERSHADMQQLRRRLSADAHNTSAATRAGPYGRTPTGEGSSHRVPLAAQGLNERHAAPVSCSRAQLQARGSRYASAGELRWAMRRLLGDPGAALFAASTDIHCAGLELLTGDRATAEDALRRAYDGLASSGEKYLLAPIAELLVQVVSAQGAWTKPSRSLERRRSSRRAMTWSFSGRRSAERLTPGGNAPTRRSGALASPSS